MTWLLWTLARWCARLEKKAGKMDGRLQRLACARMNAATDRRLEKLHDETLRLNR